MTHPILDLILAPPGTEHRFRYLHPPLPELGMPPEERHVVLPAERRPVYRGIQVIRPPIARLLPGPAGEVRDQLGPPGVRRGVRRLGEDRPHHDRVLPGGPGPAGPRNRRRGGGGGAAMMVVVFPGGEGGSSDMILCATR